MGVKGVMRYKYWVGLGASIILGLIFVAAGTGKLSAETELLAISQVKSFLGPTFVGMVSDYLPWVELVLGILLIIGFATKLMACFSTLLIFAFIGTNSWMIKLGRAYEPCSCFGVFDKVFLGKLSTMDSLYLDIGMLALVLIILFYYPSDILTIRPWFLRKR